MDEKYVAEREIARSRARMTDLAVELSRRASPTYVREQAKEKAMMKSMEWKEQASHSPKSFGLLGAVAGWVLGSTAFKMVQKRRVERSSRVLGSQTGYSPGYTSDSYASGSQGWSDQGWNGGQTWSGTEEYARDDASAPIATQAGTADLDIDIDVARADDSGPSLKERASEKLGAFKEKAAEVKEQVRGKAAEVRGKSSGMTESMRGRAHDAAGTMKNRSHELMGATRERSMHARESMQDWYGRSMNEQPWMLILGALALGSLAAYLLPVTSKEQRVLSPAKSRVREQIEKVGEAVETKLAGTEQSGIENATSSEYDIAQTSTPDYSAGAGTTGVSYTATSQTTFVAPTESGYTGSVGESTSNLGSSSSDIGAAPKTDQDLKTVH
jgi:hypothetical protein